MNSGDTAWVLASALVSTLYFPKHGVSIVFQELNLFPHRTVTANVFANREMRSPAGVLRTNLPTTDPAFQFFAFIATTESESGLSSPV